MEIQELKPYTVEAEGCGCKSCGCGEQYEVVFRIGSEVEEMLSTTYGNREEADDVAEYCNRAYVKGRADALERERVLREEIERLRQALREAQQQALDAAFGRKPKMSKAEKKMYNCEG